MRNTAGGTPTLPETCRCVFRERNFFPTPHRGAAASFQISCSLASMSGSLCPISSGNQRLVGSRWSRDHVLPRRQMRGAVRRGFAWRGVMHGRSGDGKNSARVSSAHQLTAVRETAAMKFGAERRGTQRLCHVAMHSQIQNAPAAGQTSSIQHSVPPNTQPPAAAQRLNKKCPRIVGKAMDRNAETQSKTGPNRLPPASLLCVSAFLRFCVSASLSPTYYTVSQ